MNKMKKYIKTIIVLTSLITSLANACSPKKSAIVTTEQAILGSESIVLATVISSQKSSDKVLFETDEIISGKETRQYFELYGYIVNKSLSNSGSIPYKNSRRKSPGSCNPTDYERGSTYLLMLRNNDIWTVYRPANEKINGENDPWLLWVKGFIAGSKYTSVK